MPRQFTKYQIATFIAIMFYAIELIGILFFNQKFFAQLFSINLLLMLALLVWTQKEKNLYFFIFFAATIFIGLAMEMIGTNTSVLFGEFYFGDVLGYKIRNVPIIIGINWFVIIYCCGISIHTLLMKAIRSIAEENGKAPMTLKMLSVIIDGATIAVFFDWLMEPVAVKLGFWHWGAAGDIPLYNYFCWFMVSILILAIFHFGKFNKQNKFAVHLLLIQLMFFLLLRTFSK